MLSIRLLGSPQILRDGQPVQLTRRKSRALVYYLAAHSRPLTRDHVLAFFWPDLERAAAQQTLRTTLHGLRKALGDKLLIDDSELALAPHVEVDARTFESHLSSPTPNPSTPLRASLQLLTSSLGLYRDDFLSGFTLPDAPQFENWASVEREHYRRLVVRGLTALSRLHESNGDHSAALDAIDRALAFDPLQEDLQRAALRLHYLSGDRAGAIRRYELLRRLLDEEMGVPPMAETRALYDAIINDALPAAKPLAPAITLRSPTSSLQPLTVTTLLFTGRLAELETLRAWMSHPARPLALIEGEPGIGKTRLAEEFIRSAGAISLVGQARELEQALPFQPIIDALRGLLVRPDWPALSESLRANLPAIWLAEAARLLPELTDRHVAPHTASLSADESRLWEGVNQFLHALAQHRHVVLFLDDLPWADASTLALLSYLLRQANARGAPIFFLAAARSVTPRSALAALLQALTREGRLQRLSLARLSVDETTSLAKQLSPTYAQPLAAWLMQAEGNPYILAELIRYARKNEILRADGVVNLNALPPSPVVPQSIYTLIQSRLSRLSDAARRVLDAAVAAGREFEFEVVARAAALSETAALDALDELLAAGLIQPQGLGEPRYAFDHSLTMEVAYREVGEPRHRLLHRRVAEALESSTDRQRVDVIAGIIASHFAEGNAPDRAAPYALRAAKQAASLAAWQEAIHFYEMALPGTAERERRPIDMALGEVRTHAGEFARASEDFRTALALAESDTDAAAARLALGESLLAQSRCAEAIALAQEMLAAGRAEDAARAEALWGTALSLEGADLTGATDHLNAAAAQLGEQPDPAALAQIKFELGSVAAQQGDLWKAVALYRDALVAADRAQMPGALSARILARNNLAYHLHLLGDPAALDYAQQGLQLAREHGALGLQPFLLSTLGEIALAQNDLDTAEAQFNAGLTLAESFAAQERIVGLTANLGLVAQKRGETALAIHRLSTALARADALGTRHLATQIRLWLAPLLPPAEGRAVLSEARAIAESSGRRRLLDEADRLARQLSPPDPWL